MKQMKRLTFEEQKRRTENIAEVENGNKSFRYRHRIKDYMPGQVYYNMGEYPSHTLKFAPTEYDHKLLQEIADNGADFIQIHMEWIDIMRYIGGDKFTCPDPDGMKEFVKAAHSHGLKVIAYISSGFFEMTDPDYTEDFKPSNPLIEVYYHLGRCSASSPEWISYIMPRIEALLDTYGLDGLYNDLGTPDLGEDSTHLSRVYNEDMMYRIYNMIKARGGIYKIHISGPHGIPYDEKVYDYIWVGEGCRNYAEFEKTRNHKPYVVPVIDSRHIPDTDPDEQYTHFIPFLQFPMLKYGRPKTGALLDFEIEGIDWAEEIVTQHYRKIKEWYESHKNGPYCYSEWSATPDNPLAIESWYKYLALYKEMVTEGSICHIDIKETDLVKSEITEKIAVSTFTNEKIYMAASNMSNETYKLELADEWTDRLTGVKSKEFTIEPNKMALLVK